MPRKLDSLLTLAVLLTANALPLDAQDAGANEPVAAPTPPGEYLGHPVGADFRLAGWETITSYLAHLAEVAPAIRIDTLGRTTQGRPFVVITATSPENMSRLDEIRRAQAKLADPRRLGDGELEALLGDQPAVVLITHNIHSTEVASSQGSMELVYALATDRALAELLRDVVVLLIPSVNPDGQQMVSEWYQRTLGTPYEGSSMPWLYHHYVGHDNNRDWYMLTQVETQMLNDLLYEMWRPEVVYDVHQMGDNGPRFFVPPFDDPANPNIDPLLVREISLFGLQISTDLEAAQKAGVVNRQRFDLWWHGGLRTAPARHNMVGILSEAASARLASPVFLEPDGLRQPEHGVNYPNPWPGGWWRVRDILDYQLIAARSIIELAALQREKLLRNYVELGRRAIETGTRGSPFAFVVPADQRDPGSAAAMLAILQRGGVEVHRAASAFVADGIEYAAGSHVVLMAQPYRAHAKDLLERQVYPDRRIYPGGPPDTPYDAAGWTLPLQMGVEALAVTAPFDADLELVDSPVRPSPGAVTGSGPTFLLDYSVNAANLAINRVLTDGGTAALLTEPVRQDAGDWPIGSALVTGDGARETLEELARTEGLSARSFSGSVRAARIQSPRVGLYQPWTASMDEGWTRWLFDSWSLPYRTIHDAEIRAGGLLQRYDVIVLPDVWATSLVEGRAAGTVPAEYAGGLGARGVEAIRAFVRGGGTLICLDSSSDLAIEQLGLPVANVQPSFDEIRSGEAFYAPGSLLEVALDPTHPLGYGMPESTAIYYANGPVFEVDAGADEVTVIALYPDAGHLLSGYAVHPEFLSGKAALVEARSGAGRVILFGFRPQHRGQPHETFKMLFNAVYRGAADASAPATY